MMTSQAQGAHMEVANEGQLLGRVSCRLGLQGRQLIAAKHAGLRNEEDAALAVLHHRAAGVVLPAHWYLHSLASPVDCVRTGFLNLCTQATYSPRRTWSLCFKGRNC